MNDFIKQKVRRIFFFIAIIIGMPLLFIAGATLEARHEYFSSDDYGGFGAESELPGSNTIQENIFQGSDNYGGFGRESELPGVSGSPFVYDALDIYGDPTEVVQFEEGLSRISTPETVRDIDFGLDYFGDFTDTGQYGLDYFGDFTDTKALGEATGGVTSAAGSIFEGAQDALETLTSGFQDALDSVINELGLGDVLNDLGLGDLVGGAGGILGGAEGILGGGLGGAIGGITGLFGGGASFVPVKDFAQIALQQRQVTKEYSLDPVAYLASKTTIRGILGNVLNFINTGDNGNPFYVTNSAVHFQDIERQAIEKFLTEVNILGINPNVQRSIAINASPNYSKAIQPTVGAAERNAFLQNFNNGGWDMWLRMSQSQNNPLGQYLLSSAELDRRKQEAELREAQELAWGRGYKSAKVCLLKDPLGNCLYNEIVTPGAFIENQQASVFSSIIRQLEADDEFQEITSRLLSGMLTQILGGRETGLRGFSPQQISSPVADAPAVARTKSGLRDAIALTLSKEQEYLTKKTSSLTRLSQTKDSLETLLSPRVYDFTEPLKSRVAGNTELSQTVEANRLYATTTINQLIIPAQKILTSDVIVSLQLIERIRTLEGELAAARTPNDLLIVSNRYVELSRIAHGESSIGNVNEESNVLNTFTANAQSEVSSRHAKENEIIGKIKIEFSGSSLTN